MAAGAAIGLPMVVASGTAHASGLAFTPGDVVVYRVGNGTETLVNTGDSVWLDEYSPTGALVQSVAMPTTVSGVNKALIASGTATSEGLLTRSADGQYLLLTGYDATIPTAGLVSTTATAVPRTVGEVDSQGNIDTSTALTDFASGNNPRSAASNDGKNLWIDGAAGGVRYATLGASSSTQLSTTVTNLRQAGIFGGQLFVSDSSGSAVRLGAVGSGLPTTAGQTIANLPGFETSGSPYAFFLTTLGSGPGFDTLYVADDTASTGGIQKWTLANGNWTLTATVTAAGSVRGLTATVKGSAVTLYATTGGSSATGGGTLWSYTDTSGLGGAPNGTLTTVATAASGEAFRGVALAPVAAVAVQTPEVPVSVLLPLGAFTILSGAVLVGRRRKANSI
jgi:hypothetical protein